MNTPRDTSTPSEAPGPAGAEADAGRARRRSLLGKVTLVLVSTLGALVLAEIVLTVAAAVFPAVEYRLSRQLDKSLPDDRLGLRPHPFHPEHDRLGFRNETVPEHPCVMALGDSQTYGHKVRSFEAWPRVLAERLGTPVYNVAFGGYGPTHELLLWSEVSSLEPRIVVVGLYFGNDLYDSYHHVWIDGQLAELRRPDPALEAAMAREGAEIDFGPDTAGAWVDDGDHGTVRSWLAERSKVYGVARNAKRAWLADQARERENPYFATDWSLVRRLSAGRDGLLIFESEDHRTVFTPHQRLLALNPDDPRVVEGHRLSMDALTTLTERVRATGAEIAVLFLPSKELAYWPTYLEAMGSPDGEMTRQMRAEEMWRARTREHLTRLGVPIVDALPALRHALDQGPSPYPLSANSHKNEHGHRVVARAVARALEAHFPAVLDACRETKR